MRMDVRRRYALHEHSPGPSLPTCNGIGGAEAVGVAGGSGEGGGFLDGDLEYRGDDHLCDAHAGGDDKRFGAVVDKNNFNLATVAFVDGAGGVEYGNAVFMGESAAWSDLRLCALG